MPEMRSSLNSRASRELNRAGTDTNTRRWTRHGSTRRLFDDKSVAAAVAYTLDEQGPPMATHDPRPQRAAHEVSAIIVPNPPTPTSCADGSGNALTSCAAQDAGGCETSTPKRAAHEVSVSNVPNPPPLPSCAGAAGKALTSCAAQDAGGCEPSPPKRAAHEVSVSNVPNPPPLPSCVGTAGNALTSCAAQNAGGCEPSPPKRAAHEVSVLNVPNPQIASRL